MRSVLILGCVLALAACGADVTTADPSASALATCGAYPPPPLNVGPEIQHIKVTGTMVDVPSACTVRVRITRTTAWDVTSYDDHVIVLRAMSRTTFKTTSQGDLDAIGRFRLKPGDVFTLSFDSRPFPDGTYPLNFMNW